MQKITRFFVKLIQHILPDAYLLAVLLTLIVLVAGMVINGKSFFQMAQYWGTGFPKLFNFAMQMCLLMLCGYVLALTPLMRKIINRVVSIPKTPRQAVAVTAFFGMVFCYFNWGFGMVVGAILAKAMGSKLKGIHFPLLVAASYGGELVRGPSSSIPLVSATPGNFMTKLGMPVVPVTETLYSPWNIICTILLLIALVTYFYSMKVDPQDIVEYHAAPEPEPEPLNRAKMTFAEKWEHSYIFSVLLALIPITYLALNFSKLGFNLNMNLVILIFLSLGLLLHKDPMAYLGAVQTAIGATKGIMIQFPLYAGISSMMVGSGLVTTLSNWFVAISTPMTFPSLTFLSAGLVNIMIPSGGGQWAIQGPIMIKAAQEMGANLPQTIMAFAWGDGWTNQIQPFWALPLLSVVGLNARDIMGYLVVWTIISGIIITGTFTVLSML
ncbi:MAG: short-chain fatty acid transporter [Acidaminococcaceae bacterium]|nr:short-chain fatty acid transporter [Acidaminococcaceae bacterium]